MTDEHYDKGTIVIRSTLNLPLKTELNAQSENNSNTVIPNLMLCNHKFKKV